MGFNFVAVLGRLISTLSSNLTKMYGFTLATKVSIHAKSAQFASGGQEPF